MTVKRMALVPGIGRIAIGFVLAAWAGSAAGAGLSADGIIKLVSGTTVETKTITGDRPFTITFNADGTIEGRIERQEDVATDKGKWWTLDNRLLCWQFERFGQNKRRCVTVARDGKRIVRWRGDNGGPVTGADWTIAREGPQARLVASAGATRAPQAVPSRAPSPSAPTIGLGAPEIAALFSGATIEAVSRVTGDPVSMIFGADGTLQGEVRGPVAVPRDSGRWWADERSLVCWQWQRWSKGRKLCNRVIRNGDRIARRVPNGKEPAPGKDWRIAKDGPRTASVASTSWSGAAQQVAALRARPPADRTPPSIDVPGSLTAEAGVVEIAGRVIAAAKIVEVTVNARPVSLAPDGSFTVRRGVPHGTSTIVVAALDEWGNRATRNVTVRRPPSAAPATAAAPAETYADIDFGNYYALVVGNDKYRQLTRLKTAEQDAKAVARMLKESYGFEVKLLLNATRADLLGALTELRGKLTADDNLLVYYAGHGELDEVAEQGYWLPVDAETNVPTNWVSISDITVMVRAIRAKHILVVADSCYSGTLVRDAGVHLKTASARRAWLERMVGKRARTALVSGGLEPVLDGGGGGHSVFAKAFLDALGENQGILDGEALFDRIKRPVVVNSDQTPQYSDIRNAGHDGGDFIFVRRLRPRAGLP